MNLLKYIQGNRKGKEANRLELKAMKDPFLSESLEGYDSVPGNHAVNITDLRKKISRQTQKRNRLIAKVSIAAGFLLCITMGSYFLWKGVLPFEQKELAIAKDEDYSEKATPVPVQETIDSVERSRKEDISSVKNSSLERKKISNSKKETRLQKEEELLQQELSFSPQEETINTQKEVGITDTTGYDFNTIVLAGWGTGMDISWDSAENAGKEVTENNELLKEKCKEAAARRDSFLIHVNAGRPETCVAAQVKQTAFSPHGTTVSPSLTSFSVPEKKEEVCPADSLPDTVPVPVTGWKAYKKYLKKNLRLPATGDCQDIKGTVVLELNVDLTGNPILIRVKKSLCPALDEEAIRLVKEGSRWTKGKKDVQVKVKF
ncbi:energy transducer TonB [Parabacteroides pacaensis]|uniref:energy transducer TonB n=1 Tax=Parabacteroides pacaensis TaxID=2086575 RepID=UPI000D0E61E4|nr:energy transducer TonB [Parabacteroides pacaensis]